MEAPAPTRTRYYIRAVGKQRWRAHYILKRWTTYREEEQRSRWHCNGVSTFLSLLPIINLFSRATRNYASFSSIVRALTQSILTTSFGLRPSTRVAAIEVMTISLLPLPSHKYYFSRLGSGSEGLRSLGVVNFQFSRSQKALKKGLAPSPLLIAFLGKNLKEFLNLIIRSTL